MKVACDECEKVTADPVDWIKTEPYGITTSYHGYNPYDAWFCSAPCLIAYFTDIAIRRQTTGL